jgi:hypothetical protein
MLLKKKVNQTLLINYTSRQELKELSTGYR